MRVRIGSIAHFGVIATVVFLRAQTAYAQSWVTYSAALGTFPEAQCFQKTVDANPPPGPYPLEIVGGDLHLSTLGLQSDGVNGAAVYWQRGDVPIDFGNGVAVEARLRIASAPDRAVNPATGWPRPGYSVAVYDAHGHMFWVGFGSGRVFLSNTSYGLYDSPNTVDMPFDTTDSHHTYRLAVSTTGATLEIDGVQRLAMAGLGPVEGTAGGNGQVWFGDGTYWANSDSYTSWVRFTGVGSGPITGVTGPESATTCPGGGASFAVTASGSGPFMYLWQIQTDPGGGEAGWRGLGNDPFPMPCGGGAFAYASPINSSAVNIGIHPCAGVSQYRIRCVVSNPCGSVASNEATYTIETYTFVDALKAMRIVGGLSQASATDVACLGLTHTGSVTLRDVVMIARKAAGIDPNP
ncbi:MAG TPA: hypothetical protein VGM51_05370 [Armatimonadota bacterium]|jgi:hypothetical protein